MKRIHWIAIATGFGLLIAALFIFAFAKREDILQKVIARTIISQRKNNHLILSVGSSKFIGLSTILLDRIVVIPENRDSLMLVSSVRVSVRLWPLVTGKIKLASLSVNQGWVHLVKHKGLRNYDFLFKKSDSTLPRKKADYGELANRLLESAFNKIPDEMNITNFMVKKIDDQEAFALLTKDAVIKNGHLKAVFHWAESSIDWYLQGKVDAAAQQVNLKFFAASKPVSIPYLQSHYNLGLSVDTMYMSVNGFNYTGDALTINGMMGVNNLVINQAKVATENIIFPNAAIDAKLIIGTNFISLDSASTIHLRELKAHPYIKYTTGAEKSYALMFKTENTAAQKFFDSFPSGIFTTLTGIKVAGTVSYRLDFALNENHPDDLVFDAGFQKHGFKVLKFGAENLQKINGSFVYTPYEYGKPMRSRLIGPGNSNYAGTSEISPYLRATVVASEDPNFYTHHGIDEYAFRKVIAIDYKAKSFKRGASTITMQLVKNVFLSREKTISRKAEEMLIAWLLENSGLTTKQRILEVYLNLIEWAPNIYGVGEASRFYFGKAPSGLTLGESIFLTSIIPKPKAYQYSFNADGSLKNYIKKYYRFISNSLLSKGKILASDTSSMFQISLTGPAAKYVIKTPPTEADTASATDSSKGNFFDRLINSFKSRDDTEPARAVKNTKAQSPVIDSARLQRQEKRAERRKRNKGKFLGIF